MVNPVPVATYSVRDFRAHLRAALARLPEGPIMVASWGQRPVAYVLSAEAWDELQTRLAALTAEASGHINIAVPAAAVWGQTQTSAPELASSGDRGGAWWQSTESPTAGWRCFLGGKESARFLCCALPGGPMEFTIQDNGFQVESGRVKYQWFRLTDPTVGNDFYRAVAFRELTYLPIESRDDPDMLGKQWAALRGLYNASADFVYTAWGAFLPQRLGVVQFYGAAAEHADRTQAAREALRRMAAVEATLANFPQSRTICPDLARIEMLTTRLQRLPKLLAILGHPDPRLARKGLGRDGALGMADDEFISQQGENLLRGLARLNEDFVFLVTAAHIPRPVLTQSMIRMAQIASGVASRQRGSIGASFSMAIPLAAALGQSYAQNVGHATSTRRQPRRYGQRWLESERVVVVGAQRRAGHQPRHIAHREPVGDRWRQRFARRH